MKKAQSLVFRLVLPVLALGLLFTLPLRAQSSHQESRPTVVPLEVEVEDGSIDHLSQKIHESLANIFAYQQEYSTISLEQLQETAKNLGVKVNRLGRDDLDKLLTTLNADYYVQARVFLEKDQRWLELKLLDSSDHKVVREARVPYGDTISRLLTIDLRRAVRKLSEQEQE